VTGSPSFYYDVSSPYAYLTAERIDRVLPAPVSWQPIALGALFRAIGKVPWSLTPDQRGPGVAEVERRAAERGLPPVRWPEGWPDRSYSLLPLRAILVARASGQDRQLTMGLYRMAFVQGRALNDPETLGEVLDACGLDPAAVLDAARSPEVKEELRAATERAQRRGVTGVPTVAVGEQLFWGDDRLEEAVAALA
jgi:2-hydroxychromene-2-carboxylate isomerase